MGGSNSIDNLVRLTTKEHYVAHHLLWKIHKNQPMSLAFWNMSITRDKKYITAKTYELLRNNVIEYARERMSVPENRDHLRRISTGHVVSAETRDKISKALSGRKQDPTVVKRRADSNRGKRKGKTFEEIYGDELAAELKHNLSIKNKGKIQSQETIEKRRASLIGREVSNDTRKKISIANAGRTRSEETVRKISEGHKGIKQSDETKLKRSRSLIGRPKSEEHKQNMRKPKSEEHKKKISETKQRKKLEKIANSQKETLFDFTNC